MAEPPNIGELLVNADPRGSNKPKIDHVTTTIQIHNTVTSMRIQGYSLE